MLPFILPGQTRFYWPVFGYLGAALGGHGAGGAASTAGTPIGLLLILTKAA